MKDFDIIKSLVGENVTETDLYTVDCYVRPEIGVFIPAAGPCGYAFNKNHSHPSYMVVIYFDEKDELKGLYNATVTAPGIPHDDAEGRDYYCVLIKKDYFERRYLMYSDKLPDFKEYSRLARAVYFRSLVKRLRYGFEIPLADIKPEPRTARINYKERERLIQKP